MTTSKHLLLGPLLLVPFVPIVIGACATTNHPGGDAGPIPELDVTRGPGALIHIAAPWTTEFMGKAYLVADEIFIEGPKGLLEHVVVRQDRDVSVYEVKTTIHGLRQETRARPDVGFVEIHGSLDAWAMVAFRRFVLLECPGDVPVVVRARGRAVFQRSDGSDEMRAETLEFLGRREP
ncbi:MAG: hypothetical protein O7B99_10970 [Planctomycetota bacterium]|nr:hypothetical protein [Planctomycetota bacterium]